MIDLEGELNTAGDAGEAFAILRDLGADVSALVGDPIYGAIGLSKIRPSAEGLYDPTEGPGRAAILLGVRDPDDGEIIDIVAFDPERPSKFWRRTGAAPFLGWECVDRAGHYGEPLTLFPDPLAWLRGGCAGAVWLDTDRSLSFWLATVPTIHATTPALGRAIDRRLKDEWRMHGPRVLVPMREAA